jgi:hypothetical protein
MGNTIVQLRGLFCSGRIDGAGIQCNDCVSRRYPTDLPRKDYGHNWLFGGHGLTGRSCERGRSRSLRPPKPKFVPSTRGIRKRPHVPITRCHREAPCPGSRYLVLSQEWSEESIGRWYRSSQTGIRKLESRDQTDLAANRETLESRASAPMNSLGSVPDSLNSCEK